eukprot:m.244800 g.244800  ORF g.244800 m.244800 type:complete len:4694 (-) comp26631_c0_seq1:49-14130(-)
MWAWVCFLLLPAASLAVSNGDLRLVGSSPGAVRISGRLEVFYSNGWRGVCDDNWETTSRQQQNGGVACRQLGYPKYISASTITGPSSAFWLDDINCRGTESRLMDCFHNGWGDEDCSAPESLFLTCEDPIVSDCEATGCTECRSQTRDVCLSCPDTFVFYDNACIPSCPSGTFVSEVAGLQYCLARKLTTFLTVGQNDTNLITNSPVASQCGRDALTVGVDNPLTIRPEFTFGASGIIQFEVIFGCEKVNSRAELVLEKSSDAGRTWTSFSGCTPTSSLSCSSWTGPLMSNSVRAGQVAGSWKRVTYVLPTSLDKTRVKIRMTASGDFAVRALYVGSLCTGCANLGKCDEGDLCICDSGSNPESDTCKIASSGPQSWQEDFEGSLSPLWNIVGGSVSDTTPCGTAASGKSVVFRSQGDRTISLGPLNLASADLLQFSVRLGDSVSETTCTSLLCCDSSQSYASVLLSYSVDNGGTFQRLGIYSTSGTYSISLPSAAKTLNTVFTWQQSWNAAEYEAAWSLDDVFVGGTNSKPTSIINSLNSTLPMTDFVSYTGGAVGQYCGQDALVFNQTNLFQELSTVPMNVPGGTQLQFYISFGCDAVIQANNTFDVSVEYSTDNGATWDKYLSGCTVSPALAGDTACDQWATGLSGSVLSASSFKPGWTRVTLIAGLAGTTNINGSSVRFRLRSDTPNRFWAVRQLYVSDDCAAGCGGHGRCLPLGGCACDDGYAPTTSSPIRCVANPGTNSAGARVSFEQGVAGADVTEVVDVLRGASAVAPDSLCGVVAGGNALQFRSELGERKLVTKDMNALEASVVNFKLKFPPAIPPPPTSGRSDVRLVGGTKSQTQWTGRLEVKRSGTWAGVCDDSFNAPDGTVACRNLGLGEYVGQMSNVPYSPNSFFWLDDLRCTGSETWLGACNHNGWGNEDCSASEHTGIICNVLSFEPDCSTLCCDVDPSHGIVFAYSTDGGLSYHRLGRYYGSPYDNEGGAEVVVTLPDDAKTTATRFMWWQPSFRGAFQDVWMIDNVFIGYETSTLQSRISDEFLQPISVTGNWLFHPNGELSGTTKCADRDHVLLFESVGENIGDVSLTSRDLSLTGNATTILQASLYPKLAPRLTGSGVSFGTTCGLTSPGGAVFDRPQAMRTLVTPVLNTQVDGLVVSFTFAMGDAAGCSSPGSDKPVLFQYSTVETADPIPANLSATSWTTLVSLNATAATQIFVNLDNHPAARNPLTRFRWMHSSHPMEAIWALQSLSIARGAWSGVSPTPVPYLQFDINLKCNNTPTEENFAVSLSYSTDYGRNWNALHPACQPISDSSCNSWRLLEGNLLSSSQVSQWARVTLDLPTTWEQARLRWHVTSNAEVGAWAMDNVFVGYGCPLGCSGHGRCLGTGCVCDVGYVLNTTESGTCVPDPAQPRPSLFKVDFDGSNGLSDNFVAFSGALILDDDAEGSCGSLGTDRAVQVRGDSSRKLATVDLDTRNATFAEFILQLGKAGDSSCSDTTCCPPGTPAEGVVFAYSVNGGMSYQLANTASGRAVFSGSSFTTATRVMVPLPSEARTASTRFMWWQPAASFDTGLQKDSAVWSLDSIYIGPALQARPTRVVADFSGDTLNDDHFIFQMGTISRFCDRDAIRFTQSYDKGLAQLATTPLDLPDNSFLQFYITMGGCGDPSINFYVNVEYSDDLGDTWSLLGPSCNPITSASCSSWLLQGGTSLSSIEYSRGWHRVNVFLGTNIPAGRRFRWRLLEPSSTSTKVDWAISGVYIGACQFACAGHGFCERNQCSCDPGYEVNTTSNTCVPIANSLATELRDTFRSSVINRDNWDQGSFGGRVALSECGTLSAGRSLQVDGQGKRRLVTQDLDTTDALFIYFYIQLGDSTPDSGTCSVATCCNPILPVQGVVVSFSVDGGMTYSLLNDSTSLSNPSRFASTFFNTPREWGLLLPAEARAPSTRFMWWQPQQEIAANQAEWILDDVYVGGSTNSPTEVIENFSDPSVTTSNFLYHPNGNVGTYCDRRGIKFVGAGMQSLTTLPLNLGDNSILQFLLTTGCAGSPPPEITISIQFSDDFGITWTQVSTECDPVGDVLCSSWVDGGSAVQTGNSFGQWRRYTFKLGDGIPPSRMYRWSAPDAADSSQVWHLADIYIGNACPDACAGSGQCSASGCICDSTHEPQGNTCVWKEPPPTSLREDFEDGGLSNSAKWAKSLGASAEPNSVCGVLASDTALLFKESGDRLLISARLNLTDAKFVSFYVALGDDSSGSCNAGTCCNPSLPAEGIVVAYSADNQLSWHLVGARSQSVIVDPAYNVPTQLSLTLPPAARGVGVNIMFWQPVHGTANRDVWSLDNIFIGGSASPPTFIADSLEGPTLSSSFLFASNAAFEAFCMGKRLVFSGSSGAQTLETSNVQLTNDSYVQFTLTSGCTDISTISNDWTVALEISLDDGESWSLLDVGCPSANSATCSSFSSPGGTTYFPHEFHATRSYTVPVNIGQPFRPFPSDLAVLHFRKAEEDFTVTNPFPNQQSRLSYCFWHQNDITSFTDDMALISYATGSQDALNFIYSSPTTVFVEFTNWGYTISVSQLDLEWHHFCVTWSQLTNNLVVFRNGQFVRSAITSSWTLNLHQVGTLTLGGRRSTITSDKVDAYFGSLFGVNFWSNTVLSRNDVRAVFERDTTAPSVFLSYETLLTGHAVGPVVRSRKDRDFSNTRFRWRGPRDRDVKWGISDVYIGSGCVNGCGGVGVCNSTAQCRCDNSNFVAQGAACVPRPDALATGFLDAFTADSFTTSEYSAIFGASVVGGDDSCGPVGGTNFVRFNSNLQSQRALATVDLDTRNALFLQFQLLFGPDTSNCESLCCGPNLPAESIVVAYSTNGGMSWQPLNTFANSSNGIISRPLTQVTPITIDLPPTAKTATTRFMIFQPSFRSTLANWAIDNLFVGPTGGDFPQAVVDNFDDQVENINWLSFDPENAKEHCESDGKALVQSGPIDSLQVVTSDMEFDFSQLEVFADDLGVGPEAGLWSASEGYVVGSRCGLPSSGLVFDQNSGARLLATRDIDTRPADLELTFYFGFGIGNNCDPPEPFASPKEEVVVEVSTDAGSSWREIHRLEFSSDATEASLVLLDLNGVVSHEKTRFRWRQTAFTRNPATSDVWGLAQVRLAQHPYVYVQHDVTTLSATCESGTSDVSNKFKLEFSSDFGGTWNDLATAECSPLSTTCLTTSPASEYISRALSSRWSRHTWKLSAAGSLLDKRLRFRWSGSGTGDDTLALDNMYVGVTCPAGCTNHGKCLANGACDCDTGYSGTSCEIAANLPQQFEDDFESDKTSSWLTFSGDRSGRTCGQAPSQSIAGVVISAPNGVLETPDLDLTFGTSLDFYSAGCTRGFNSILTISFSTNGGQTYQHFDTQSYFPSQSNPSGTLMSTPLTEATKTTSTRFQIRATSGTMGLDNFSIGGPCRKETCIAAFSECVDKPNGEFECVCQEGYDGDADLNTCRPDPCTNVICNNPPACQTGGTCSSGTCTYDPADNGTSCDDNDPTTKNDQCISETCVGVSKCLNVTCLPPGDCFEAVCVATTGRCAFTTKDAGSTCANGAGTCNSLGQCTGIDRCATVQCQPLSVCHVSGVCNPADGICSNPTVATGTVCDTGDNTTTGECNSGVCVPTPKCLGVSCGSSNQCLVGYCVPSTGECDERPALAGLSCDDRVEKTFNDTCDGSGGCAGTECVGPSCQLFDQCCIDDGCNSFLSDGTSCNAGSLAEPKPGACAAGLCVEQDLCQGVVCSAISLCHTSGACDPQTGQCSTPLRPEGAACDDGLISTTNDTCNSNGTCAGVEKCTGVVCPETSDCIQFSQCFAVTGQCNTIFAPRDFPCTSETVTGSGKCDGQGVCVGACDVSCSTATECMQAGSCSSQGVCERDPKPQGTSCTDGNSQTRDDECNASGECVGVLDACLSTSCPDTPGPCLVALPCNNGSCPTEVAADQTDCVDISKGIGQGKCESGECTRVGLCAAVDCRGQPAPSPCMLPPVCVDGECQSSANTSAQGISCIRSEQPLALGICNDQGTCVDPCVGITCTPLSQCHDAGQCELGVCSQPFKANGAACNDGDDTTTDDVCTAGQCQGVSLCENVECINEQCRAESKCFEGTCFSGLDVSLVGQSCDDGLNNTRDDACSADGACRGVPDLCFDVSCLDNACQRRGACNPSTGQCVYAQVLVGQVCDDGDVNTEGDTCNALGVCEGHRQADCLDALKGPNGKGCGPGNCLDLVPRNGFFSCDCSGTGFTGDNCDVPAPTTATKNSQQSTATPTVAIQCASSPCDNGGTCFASSSTAFACRCVHPYSGPTCKLNAESCEPSPCVNNGLCQLSEHTPGFTCICATGFTGATCDTPDVNVEVTTSQSPQGGSNADQSASSSSDSGNDLLFYIIAAVAGLLLIILIIVIVICCRRRRKGTHLVPKDTTTIQAFNPMFTTDPHPSGHPNGYGNGNGGELNSAGSARNRNGRLPPRPTASGPAVNSWVPTEQEYESLTISKEKDLEGQGYEIPIPACEVYDAPRNEPPFVHGLLSASEAVNLLKNKSLGGNRPGAYLIRRRNHEPGQYAISRVQADGTIQHSSLTHSSQRGWRVGPNKCGEPGHSWDDLVSILNSPRYKLDLTYPIRKEMQYETVNYEESDEMSNKHVDEDIYDETDTNATSGPKDYLDVAPEEEHGIEAPVMYDNVIQNKSYVPVNPE